MGGGQSRGIHPSPGRGASCLAPAEKGSKAVMNVRVTLSEPLDTGPAAGNEAQVFDIGIAEQEGYGRDMFPGDLEDLLDSRFSFRSEDE